MPYRYAFVTAGSAKYTFLVPDRYRVDSSDPAKVKLNSPDCARIIAVGFNSGGAAGGVRSAEGLREFVNKHYTDVEFLADQVVCAGRGFHLEGGLGHHAHHPHRCFSGCYRTFGIHRDHQS